VQTETCIDMSLLQLNHMASFKMHNKITLGTSWPHHAPWMPRRWERNVFMGIMLGEGCDILVLAAKQGNLTHKKTRKKWNAEDDGEWPAYDVPVRGWIGMMRKRLCRQREREREMVAQG